MRKKARCWYREAGASLELSVRQKKLFLDKILDNFASWFAFVNSFAQVEWLLNLYKQEQKVFQLELIVLEIIKIYYVRTDAS